MRLRLPSTSARLALVVMGFFLAAFVLLGAGLYYAVSTLLLQDARELVRTDAAALQDIHQQGGRAALLAELQARIAGNGDPDAVYALAARDGTASVGRLPDARVPDAHGRWVEFNEPDLDARDATLRVIAF